MNRYQRLQSGFLGVLLLALGTLLTSETVNAQTELDKAAGAPQVVRKSSCIPSSSSMCLRDNRFQVDVQWTDFQGNSGSGSVAPFGTDESGVFWFFGPDNLEFLVKVLNGCSLNDRFWVFASATTNVEYQLTVTDTMTGDSAVYTNPLGTLAPAIADTSALATCQFPSGPLGSPHGTPHVWSSSPGCTPSTTTHCVRDGRFKVEIDWEDFDGNTGPGRVVPYGTEESGLFWFFGENNYEVLFKVINGCGLNDHFWFFSAATTNVGYDITVTDTLTGLTNTYHNDVGQLADAIGDTSAFASCDVDQTAPSPPGPTTSPDCVSMSGGTCFVNNGNFTIQAAPASDPGGSGIDTDGYQVCRSYNTNGSGSCQVVMSNSSGTSFVVTGSHRPPENQRRAYFFRAFDNAGNPSAYNQPLYVQTLEDTSDTTPPSTVSNLSATINGQDVSGLQVPSTSPVIQLDWDHATDASGIYRYQIALNRPGTGDVQSVFTLFPNDSYTLTTNNLVIGASYRVRIRAQDNADLWGNWVNSGTFTVIGNPDGELWSDPGTWGGTVPGPATSVVIPAGKRVILDTFADVRNLSINGELIALQGLDLELKANWILVEGQGALFQWGEAADPYTNRGIITLKHAPADTIPGPGTKFLAARNGGRVEMHGMEKRSWTQLSQTAAKDATTITLAQSATNWAVGDEIVIASTDFEAHQAEKRTITAISGNQRTISLDEPLDYMHYGVLQSYDSGARQLDERAEVGLLSRNITIQGDAASESAGFGGHTMFMPSSVVHVSGVEFYRMGQLGELARYPFHWHFAGNVSGQYIRNSSIHRSYNRVVTVHGSNYALVENNVGYDHIGHGYFLEDGDEVGNRFINNLGILTRAANPADAVIPTDIVTSERGLLKLPATFWITNPDNTFIGNAAAGSEGSGFWMVVPNGAPGRKDIRQFDDNRAHSNSFSNFTIDGSLDANGELVYGHYRPKTEQGGQIIPQINGFTGFKVRERNVWMRANTMHFRDTALADSPRNTFFAFNQILMDSLIVGKSGNVGNPQTPNEVTAGRSLALPQYAATHTWNIFSGHTIYDGPTGLSGVHLASFSGNNAAAFNTNAAAQKSPVHWVEDLSFENVPFENMVRFGNATSAETMYASGIIDRDGSLTGVANIHMLPRIEPHPSFPLRVSEDGFNREPSAMLVDEWDAYLNTSAHFGLLRLDHFWGQGNGTPVYNIRSDGPATFGDQIFKWWNMNPVIVNSGYRYTTQFHRIAHRTDAVLLFVNPQDSVVSVFTNMPSSTRVYNANGGALPQASSLSQLESGGSQRYFFRDNTLYLKHIAVNGTADYRYQYGQEFSGVSPYIRICQLQNCQDAQGFTEFVTFADFEMGLDSRGGLTTSGDLPVPTLVTDVTNPATAPFDGVDNSVRWTMPNDGDGTTEYVDLTFDIDRQVWTGFNYLTVRSSGPDFEVLIHDQAEGWLNLGTHSAANPQQIPLNASANRDYLDHVDKVRIRVHEFEQTRRKPSEFAESGSQQVRLFGIELSKELQ